MNIIQSKKIPLLSILLLSLVATAVFFSQVGTAAPLSGEIDGHQVKSAGQTVIITRNPEAVKAFAHSRAADVAEERRMSSGRSIITLNERPFSSVTAAAKQHFPDAIVGPNQTYQVLLEPDDTNYSDQWNLSKISAPKAWDVTTGSIDTVIAVIDTGVLFEQQWGDAGPFMQPDLPSSKRWTNAGEMGATSDEGDEPNCTSQGLELDKSCNNLDDDDNGMVDDWQGWDFMGGFRGDAGCPNFNDPDTYEYPGLDPDSTDLVMQDNDPQPYSCDDPNDKNQLNKTHFDAGCDYGAGACFIGHGTIVGSVASSATDNGQLIAGTDWNAQVMNLRVLDGYGYTTTARVTEAVDYAAANGADVINMSLATTVCDESSKDPVLDDALASVKDSGIISVAASGNESLDTVCYPASSAHTIAVGSSNPDDKRASFSNYGPELDVIAPGTGIPAANSPSKYRNTDYLSSTAGTSLSTPHVAGQASLVKSLYPNTNLQQFKSNLIASSDKVADMDGNTRTNQHGHGRINLHKSAKHANTPHPDGSLVKLHGAPHIYLIEDSQRRHIRSPSVLKSHQFNTRIRAATLADMNLPLGSTLQLREGTLIKGSKSHIYIVDKESGTVRKRRIGSPSVFTGLGFKSKDVLKVPDRDLPSENGPTVSSADKHPDGVLVSGSSSPHIYLVQDSQKRRVLHIPALRSHQFIGGVKEAAPQDLQLTNGAHLNYREGTLIRGDDPPIYVVNYEAAVAEKRHIRTLFIFKLLDFSGSEVDRVNDNHLPANDGDHII